MRLAPFKERYNTERKNALGWVEEATTTFALEEDPLWYKDAILYELHVRAFHDSEWRWSGRFFVDSSRS